LSRVEIFDLTMSDARETRPAINPPRGERS
jgi:hypothetical protein